MIGPAFVDSVDWFNVGIFGHEETQNVQFPWSVPWFARQAP